MLGMLWNAGAFVIALGILIAVHEYGHYWVARRCGVYVERFSIGFGKALWKRTAKNGTEFTLAMIPLGGYVKMLDERVEPVPAERRHEAFNNKKLWQRSAIVAAGPIANFVFALFAYWAIFVIGVPTVKPIVGDVAPHSIAAEAGITPGMELTSVSGIKTADWESVTLGIVSRIGEDDLTLTAYSTDANRQQTFSLNLEHWSFDPESESPIQTIGITPYRPAILLELAMVAEEGAAAKAGLQVGDKLLSLAGTELQEWQQVVDIIQANPEQAVIMEIERQGQRLAIELIPDARAGHDGGVTGYAGIAPAGEAWPESYLIDLQYGPIAAVGKAAEKTWNMVALTFEMVKKLIVGDVALNNLSGPISIAKGAGTTAGYGLISFLGFLALISVNLGIVNLLPLPVLDGGHLLFNAIEGITRRPVSERVQEVGYRIGSALLVALMAVALFNDFTRL
ncbi:sigma E protease regulator RseP [Thaumasiovibrio subtropicus]|uniref:sigma E protease regulator RseP n=1 Tax=Thaumasiovibrio subtropicus TaxID=1891207 RepID=UPI000B364854|nr:sigma E protease regulator RseP [Thaumasiovibrio subtropicus]